ncbi:MAG: hypothetical protein MJ179_10080, partial [Treponema sp.]|nr:hypothetical protein [Treponema sp.]
VEEPMGFAADETIISEEPVIEESVFATEEPAVEEPIGFAADETIISEEPVIEESPVEETVVEEPVIEESPVEEPVIEETPVVVENEGFDVVEETAVEEDDLTFATEETTDSYDFSDDELPQEIDIEKDDFITTPVDSYDSSSEITSEPTITDQSLDSTGFEENNFVSNPLEDFTTLDESEITSEPEEVTFTDVFEQTPAPAVEETEAVLEIEPEEDSFLSVDDTFASVEDNFTSEETVETTETSDTVSDDLFVPSESEDTMTFATEPEPAAEEITSEPVIEDSDISEPIIEEPVFVEAAPVVEDVAPNEDLFVTSETKSELTDSNINYLTSDETIPSEMSSMEENTELKKDIKSVLLYMDQLLENLPEDKIVEFAKSEEFATYKKLFSELGLS